MTAALLAPGIVGGRTGTWPGALVWNPLGARML